jgi:sarcosine oxidase
MVNRAQIGVVGVGTVGSMAFWQLARRGADVVGFEQFVPGHTKGAAGGETRLYRVASEGPKYVPITRAALAEWRLLEAESGMDLLDLHGEVHIGRPDSELLQKVLSNAAEFGLEAEQLTPAEVRARFPKIPIDDDEIAVWERDCGTLKAASSVVAAADTAVKAGGRLLTGVTVAAVTPADDGIHVVLEGGEEWVFERVVISTGAWANQLLGEYLPRFDIRRANVQWYPLRSAEGYTSDVYTLVERDGVDFGFAAWPTHDRDTIKVGYMAALDHITGPEAFSHDMDPAALARMDGYVGRFIPDALTTCVKQAFGQDACTPDGDFVLGPLAADPRIVTALGMNLRGFKMCPAVGRAAAEWALTGSTEMPLPELGAARFRSLPTVM